MMSNVSGSSCGGLRVVSRVFFYFLARVPIPMRRALGAGDVITASSFFSADLAVGALFITSCFHALIFAALFLAMYGAAYAALIIANVTNEMSIIESGNISTKVTFLKLGMGARSPGFESFEFKFCLVHTDI